MVLNNTPLTQLPVQVRSAIYTIYLLLGTVVGAVQVGFLAAELGQPTWLTVGLAVYAFLGTSFGLTALANTPKAPDAV